MFRVTQGFLLSPNSAGGYLGNVSAVLKICLSESLANRLTTLGVRLQEKIEYGDTSIAFGNSFPYLRQGSLPFRAMTLGMGEQSELEPGCRHVRCHHKNEAIVKKGQNNINVLGANE